MTKRACPSEQEIAGKTYRCERLQIVGRAPHVVHEFNGRLRHGASIRLTWTENPFTPALTVPVEESAT